MMNEIANSDLVDEAYRWLCQQRKHFPPNADIWHFCCYYFAIKSDPLRQINTSDYQFSPLQKIIKKNGQIIYLWGSQDALVMKLMATDLQSLPSLSPPCTHVKGHGGLKQTVVDIQCHLDDHHYVCKTDVKGFYESPNQYLLME